MGDVRRGGGGEEERLERVVKMMRCYVPSRRMVMTIVVPVASRFCMVEAAEMDVQKKGESKRSREKRSSSVFFSSLRAG